MPEAAVGIGGEACASEGSAEFMPEDTSYGDNGNGDGDDDSGGGWVNTLIFGEDNVDEIIKNNDDARGDGRGEEKKQQEQLHHHEQHHRQEGPRYRSTNRCRTPGDDAHKAEGSEGDAEGGSSGSSGGRGGGGGGSERGAGESRRRRASGRNGRNGQSRGRTLSSRGWAMQRGLSEGAGQGRRVAAVATAVEETLSYSERLYRGHNEQRKVWAQR